MSERWLPLNGFKCPIIGCKGQSTAYNWVCASCKTQMLISQKGNLKCDRGTHIDPIIKWRFDCGNHGNHPVDKWKQADLEGFTFALSHAIQLTGKAGATWVAALIQELGRQYDKE